MDKLPTVDDVIARVGEWRRSCVASDVWLAELTKFSAALNQGFPEAQSAVIRVPTRGGAPRWALTIRAAPRALHVATIEVHSDHATFRSYNDTRIKCDTPEDLWRHTVSLLGDNDFQLRLRECLTREV